jgi:signal peptidase I
LAQRRVAELAAPWRRINSSARGAHPQRAEGGPRERAVRGKSQNRKGEHSMSEAGSVSKAQSAAAKPRVRTRPQVRRVVLEYVRAIGLALLLALVIRQFVIQAFRIPTGSMERTLLVGDFLFVNKFLYGAKTPDRIRLFNHTLVEGLPVLKLPALRQPQQGDIIVFQYPRDLNQDYIKRCVAVSGDTVQVKDGILYVNGDRYEQHTYHDQDKLVRGSELNRRFGPYVVPDGTIFMMGDNRYNSADSRFWGPLDVDLVKGKALFIYWSWDRDRLRPRLDRIGRLIH